MKSQKYSIIMLLLVAAILLNSCEGKLPIGSSESTGENVTQPAIESTTDETTKTPPEVDEDDAYLKIPIQECPGLVQKFYGLEDSAFALVMNFYENWDVWGDLEGGYMIFRDNKVIGRIVAGEAKDIDGWEHIYQIESQSKNPRIAEFLEKSGTGDTLKFRYRFCYRYTENSVERLITLTIAYGEIDKQTQMALRRDVITQQHHSSPMYGTLSHLRNEPILVLGNSFIGTSQIGSIFNEMVKNSGNSQTMNAYSRGYASPSSYIKDETLMNRIRSGMWKAVFICGFYGDEVAALGTLKEACDASNTQLILFPAHNENRSQIDIVKSVYPDLVCIDWKAEIEHLIDEGRSKWDFCINDAHLHSTPLAGYVGAMMIWRAIYGNMPSVSISSISQTRYNSILGSYLTNPSFQLIDTDHIAFLEEGPEN